MPTPFTSYALIAILLAGAAHTYAHTSSIPGESFYRDKERGWFWYEEPEPEPEPEPETPEEPPEPVAATPEPEPELPPTTRTNEPAVGTVAWIRDNLPRLRDQAIENPSDENIAAYYYAQRLMLDMSERFARRANEVVAADPFLDEDLRSPASSAVAEAIAVESVQARDELLHRLSEQVAVLFFYEGGNCRACAPTITALRSLSHRYGFTIMPISTDGLPLPGNPFGQTQYDTGLANHLGVLATPAIAIAAPPSGAEIVSYSAISMETAAMRILAAAQRQNLITEAELRRTERINNIGLISNQSLQDAPSNITENPADFVNRMRQEARKAFSSSGDSQ